MLRLNSLARIWNLLEPIYGKRGPYHRCPSKINAILSNSLSKSKLPNFSDSSSVQILGNERIYLAISHHGRRSVKWPPLRFCNIKEFEWTSQSLALSCASGPEETYWICSDGGRNFFSPSSSSVSDIAENGRYEEDYV
jgi:hypothetical protein